MTSAKFLMTWFFDCFLKRLLYNANKLYLISFSAKSNPLFDTVVSYSQRFQIVLNSKQKLNIKNYNVLINLLHTV